MESEMTSTTHDEGSRHSGKISFRLDAPPAPAVRCNCSLCRRTGAWMTPAFSEGNLRIISGSDDLAFYRFNTQTAKHVFCRHCGVYPFRQTLMDRGLWRANIGCPHGVDPYAFDATVNDGAGLSPAGDV
jgi:hypothetical protein